MTAVRIVVTRSETYCSIPKFWGPNSVQPRKIAGILLPFSLLSFLHFAGILEQSIHHCHSEEENKRLADSPSSVLSKGVTNTTRRCSFTKSIIPSESNATGENPTHHKETPSKADHHFWGTKRATPKQRESHYLSQNPGKTTWAD